MATSTNLVVSSEMRYCSPGGKVLLDSSSRCRTFSTVSNRVGAGELINDQDGGRDAVFAAEAGVALAGKLGARDVLHPQDRAVRQRADDHVLEFRRRPSGGP